MKAELPLDALRAQFPALSRTVDEQPAVFLDGPAGTQVPQRVIDALTSYLSRSNANHGGAFLTSLESDAIVSGARASLADLLGAPDPDLVVTGPNMTSLTMALSRSLARTWSEGDEILVCRTDHDANFTPWKLAARDAGVTVREVAVRPDTRLDLDDLRAKLSESTRLLAIGCASNAFGTKNPIAEVVPWVHEHGGLVFVDGVHSTPHELPDVTAWGCDFFACSAYKFFGPHVGILWGKRELLENLPAYKVRPASESLPDRWMNGTQNHEGIAGAGEAVEYLAALGRSVADDEPATRRAALRSAYDVIGRHERALLTRLLDGLRATADVVIHGLTEPAELAERVSTVAISSPRRTAGEIAADLAAEGIFVWSGNFYALPATEALGLEPDGVVRLGLVHYNTPDEVDRTIAAVARSVARG